MSFSSLAVPRLVIGAPQGRSGKTTLSLGLCAALAARGLRVQPFKKGPDYIDPSWLSAAAGQPCRTLDPFFMQTEANLQAAFAKGARQADVCLIEGNHGLYDEWEDGAGGSTAALARALRAPVLLVLNAARMGRSAAAMVLGYLNFEPETPIAGVILNNVSHGRHEARLRMAIERYCRIPVVGALPRQDRLSIPDRHLGLVPRGEDERLLPALEACREVVERRVDLEVVLQIAGQRAEGFAGTPETVQIRPKGAGGVRIGLLRDQAFNFYYPENLEALEEAGAELVEIDALHSRTLPPVQALYIGGGFPEMFLEELEANTSLRAQVREAASDGMPVYAECGGLMYLSRRIHWGSRSAEMCAVLPVEVEMTDRPQGHGYVLASASPGHPFLPAGAEMRGHEFHHSQLQAASDLPRGCQLQRGRGLGDGTDGLIAGHTFASYTHLHASGAPLWAPGFVNCARAYGSG